MQVYKHYVKVRISVREAQNRPTRLARTVYVYIKPI